MSKKTISSKQIQILIDNIEIFKIELTKLKDENKELREKIQELKIEKANKLDIEQLSQAVLDSLNKEIVEEDVIEEDFTVCDCDDFWFCECDCSDTTEDTVEPVVEIPTASPSEIYEIHNKLRHDAKLDCEIALKTIKEEYEEFHCYNVFCNYKTRKIIVAIYDNNGKEIDRASSTCHKRDLMSEHVGVAIAFMRLANIEIPDYYTSIPAVAE